MNVYDLLQIQIKSPDQADLKCFLATKKPVEA